MNTIHQHDGLIPFVLCPRVSTERQAKKGTSLPDQRRDGAEAIQRHGGYLAFDCPDEGVSGTFFQARPGLQEALAHIEAGRAKGICFTCVDRSGRDMSVIVEIAKRVHRAKGVLLFADLGIIRDTPEDLMKLQCFGMMAQFERANTRRRTTNGRRARAKEGVQPSRATSPYGYRVVSKADVLKGDYTLEQVGRYIVIPHEAEQVRRMFSLIAEGASLRGVAQILNADRVPVPGLTRPPYRGSEWTNCNVRGIIQNPVYKGTAVFGKHRFGQDEDRLMRGYASAQTKEKADPSEWVLIESPALVTPELWETANACLAENQKRLSGNPCRVYLLSGMVDCPDCGANMTGTTNTLCVSRRAEGCTTEPRYYHCGLSHCRKGTGSGERRCTSPRIGGPSLEALVVSAVRFAASEPEALSEAAAGFEAARARLLASGAATDAQTVIQQQEKRLAALKRREEAAVLGQVQAIESGADASVYNALFAKIAEERREARATIEAAQRTLAEIGGKGERPYLPDALEAVARAAQMVDTALNAPEEVADTSRKRRLLSLVIEKVLPQRGEKAAAATSAEVYFRLDTGKLGCGISPDHTAHPR
jgi:DNA invertase Pin-like site-specific DNA recombinase